MTNKLAEFKFNRDFQTLESTLNELSKLLIWADRNDYEIFNGFFALKGPAILLNIIKSNYEPISLLILKFLSVLIENCSRQQCIDETLKDGFLNDLIRMPLQLETDDLLSQYVTLLKNISLKATRSNFDSLFSNASQEYPLLSKSLQFITHEEPFIRTTIKTTILNLVKIGNKKFTDNLIHKEKYFRVFLNYVIRGGHEYLRLSVKQCFYLN